MLCLQQVIKIILSLMMSEWEISSSEILQFKELDIIYRRIILLTRQFSLISRHHWLNK